MEDKGAGKGFGFLFEMGCGKTLAAIAVMGAGHQLGHLGRVLVVAPSSVVPVWPKEMADCARFPYAVETMTGEKARRTEALRRLSKAPDAALKVAVINYESVWREGIFEALLAWDPDMVIADESQRIKTHDTAQSKAMHQIGDRARYKLILSGTPVQNSAVDLWSQYRFLDSSVFGKSFYAFRNRYAVMGGFNRKQIVGYRNMDDLVRREYSVAYRVTKDEALDLPDQVFENRYVALGDRARQVYDRLRRDSYAELEEGEVTATTVLTKLLRLQQLAGGFLQLDDHAAPSLVHKAKLEALMEIVRDLAAAGKKVVIFARFTPEIDLIAEALRGAGIGCAVLDGRTPMEDKVDRASGARVLGRGALVEMFQTAPGAMAMVAQIQTAGLGITLHAASTAIFYSLDFNYASYSQALARIHRIGQVQKCTYIHLLAEKSVDEKIMQALARKEDLAKTVVDGWREYFAD